MRHLIYQMPKTPAPLPSNATVAQAMAAAFRRHGVTVAFGQSIPSAFHLAAPEFGIRQITYRAENAGGCMADGYARISNRVSVVTAQNGPAATLLVPPLAEALKASIPILALVQDVPSDATDRNAFQELDHIALFQGCAKWIKRLERADRLDDFIDMAFTAAAGGRPGPAVLLVPYDLFQKAAAPFQGRTSDLGAFPLDRMAPDPARVAEAAELIANAEAPLVIAGGGVHLSDASAALVELQERCHLPIATTTMGKGAVAETHPLSVGLVGYFMGPTAVGRYQRPLVEKADVIVLIGSRTNQNGTDAWTLFPKGAHYIHIDVDSSEVGRNYESLRLVGDARLSIQALTAALSGRDLSKRKAARGAVEKGIESGRAQHRAAAKSVLTSNATPLRPERVMAELEPLVTEDTILVADASYSSIWITNFLTARRAGQRFLTPRGLAGLGWGFPMALGAKIAAPDKPVVCVVGDGGFAHCWAEMETAVRMGIPILLIVLNNGILGFQKHAELVKFKAHTDAIAFAPVDHAAIARACGAIGIRIDDPAQLKGAIAGGLRADRLTVLDVVTEPDAYPPISYFEGEIEKHTGEAR